MVSAPPTWRHCGSWSRSWPLSTLSKQLFCLNPSSSPCAAWHPSSVAPSWLWPSEPQADLPSRSASSWPPSCGPRACPARNHWNPARDLLCTKSILLITGTTSLVAFMMTIYNHGFQRHLDELLLYLPHFLLALAGFLPHLHQDLYHAAQAATPWPSPSGCCAACEGGRSPPCRVRWTPRHRPERSHRSRPQAIAELLLSSVLAFFPANFCLEWKGSEACRLLGTLSALKRRSGRTSCLP